MAELCEKRLPIAFFIVIVAAVGLLAACAGPATADTPPTRQPLTATSTPDAILLTITPDQLMRASGTNIFLVNTHVPYEGEIPSTNAFIPVDETKRRLDEYPADKQTQIVLYSRDGSMSAVAAKVLAEAGYTSVWHLEGGMLAWEAAGYELIRR